MRAGAHLSDSEAYIFLHLCAHFSVTNYVKCAAAPAPQQVWPVVVWLLSSSPSNLFLFLLLDSSPFFHWCVPGRASRARGSSGPAGAQAGPKKRVGGKRKTGAGQGCPHSRFSSAQVVLALLSSGNRRLSCWGVRRVRTSFPLTRTLCLLPAPTFVPEPVSRQAQPLLCQTKHKTFALPDQTQRRGLAQDGQRKWRPDA